MYVFLASILNILFIKSIIIRKKKYKMFISCMQCMHNIFNYCFLYFLKCILSLIDITDIITYAPLFLNRHKAHGVFSNFSFLHKIVSYFIFYQCYWVFLIRSHGFSRLWSFSANSRLVI